MNPNLVIILPLLIFSAVFHEYAHGFVAQKCGDDTASNLGRLTLNPLKHLDIFGSIILPIILILSGARFIIAWAKPVPINPTKFGHYRKDVIKVALSGVLANLVLVIFTLIFLFLIKTINFMSPSLIEICKYAVYINVLLILFNLLPIVPLDGSRIVHVFMPYQIRILIDKIEPFGFLILIILINIPIFRFIFWNLVTTISENLLRVVL